MPTTEMHRFINRDPHIQKLAKLQVGLEKLVTSLRKELLLAESDLKNVTEQLIDAVDAAKARYNAQFHPMGMASFEKGILRFSGEPHGRPVRKARRKHATKTKKRMTR